MKEIIDSGVDISRTVHSYTATAGQTAFTGLGYVFSSNQFQAKIIRLFIK